ncbi:MAG TPA: hypothetical protein VN461_10240 [Vicinamibacteria bacterium]|jgi:hypothetical protein|nr:hypothetical protein [Vicinamibacteria bacterium]
MKRSFAPILTGVVVASCMWAAPARAGIDIQIFPPAAFIATAAPVYFQGHAAYWYGGHWHYREGREWRTYSEEPRYLHEYRAHHEPERHYYGRESEHHYHERERR